MTRRNIRWSPFALFVILSPALLHLGNCGDPHLFSLEVEADSVNRVVGFAKQTHSYNIWTAGEDTIVVRTTTSEPSAAVHWRLFIDGVFQDYQPLGTGGGEATFTVPPTVASELQLDANHNGEIGRYTLNINPACTADECDDGNQCANDACVGNVCEFSPLVDGTVCDFQAVGDGICIVGVCGPVPPGATIEFDDGVEFDPVGSHYAAQGVTFDPNTIWTPNGVGVFYVGGQATAPLSISVPGYDPTVGDPIIATFAVPQSSVSILAVNVGEAGGRLDAYDTLTGGTLVGFAEDYGTTIVGETEVVPGGCSGGPSLSCQHEERELSVSAPSILRVEIYRPFDSSIDNVHFDNLTFEPASGP